MAKITFSYSRSGMSPEYCAFFKREAKRIAKILEGKGCTDIQISSGYYYFSGFFTDAKGQVWYLSCSDVRHFRYEKILYRTAKNYKDFTGGQNQYINVSDLENWGL
jgi:hypothetical protein